jgi:hypothetical protein
MPRRDRREIDISATGGVRLPRWFKRIHAVALDNGKWYFPPRYPFNDHLPASYGELGNKAWAVIETRYLSLYPQWAALTVASVALIVTATINPIFAVVAGVLLALAVLIGERTIERFGFVAAIATAVALAFWEPPLVLLPSLGFAYYLYLRWAAAVSVIQKSSVNKYWRVIARLQVDGEASSISRREPLYPRPQTLYSMLGIGSTRIWLGEDSFVVGPNHNYQRIQLLVRGVDQSMADNTRLGAESQGYDAIGNWVARIRTGVATIEDLELVADKTFVNNVAMVLKEGELRQSGQQAQPTAPESTPDETPADDTPTEPIPIVKDDRPHVFVVDGDGQTAVKEVVEMQVEIPRWKRLAHQAKLHNPTNRPSPSGKMELYCPQCDAVYREEK